MTNDTTPVATAPPEGSQPSPWWAKYPDLTQITGNLGTAVFSVDKRYRYTLTRDWNPSGPRMVWICLNPSTATADINDPTIRRAMNYAKLWGYGGMTLLNIFAFRATDPNEMKAVGERAIGAHNSECLAAETLDVPLIVCGWGVNGGFMNRDTDVIDLLLNRTLSCLGETQGGFPKHPLYLAKGLWPVVYRSVGV